MVDLEYSCYSHIGICRKVNQDNFVCNKVYMYKNNSIIFPINGTTRTNHNRIFGVFDGIGGMSRGEIASKITANVFSRGINKRISLDSLEALCFEANDFVNEFGNKNKCNIGTTAAILGFRGKKYYCCNVGDTKILLFRKKVVEQLTYDHISFSNYGKKPALTQCIGTNEDNVLSPFLLEGKIKDGDIFLIASDGLTDFVTIEEINSIICKEDFFTAAEKLIKLSLKKGGKDNITIIICRVNKRGLF